MQDVGGRGELGEEPVAGFLPQTPSSRRIVGGSDGRLTGVGMSLFYWGRNPLFLFLETGRVSARADGRGDGLSGGS